MFFVDDSLVFCKASTVESDAIMQILKKYEKASGQRINVEMSSGFFNKNMGPGDTKEVYSRLGNMKEVTQGKYLGLPMGISSLKEEV